MAVSPNMFYKSKQVSDSRYLHMSATGMEDQASTTMSNVRYSNKSHVLKKSVENPTIIRHDRNKKILMNVENKAAMVEQ